MDEAVAYDGVLFTQARVVGGDVADRPIPPHHVRGVPQEVRLL